MHKAFSEPFVKGFPLFNFQVSGFLGIKSILVGYYNIYIVGYKKNSNHHDLQNHTNGTSSVHNNSTALKPLLYIMPKYAYDKYYQMSSDYLEGISMANLKDQFIFLAEESQIRVFNIN